MPLRKVNVGSYCERINITIYTVSEKTAPLNKML